MRRAALLSLLPAVAVAQDTLSFYYGRVNDTCDWGSSNSMTANENTAHGNVCAFIPRKNRLYACPAPDQYCWAWFQKCSRGTNDPGDSQILCGNSFDSQWCCGSDEVCTQNQGQVNVCISTFQSPLWNITPSAAVSRMSAAVGANYLKTSVPTSTPSAFSTRRLGTATESTSSSSSSTSASSTRNTSSASQTSEPTSRATGGTPSNETSLGPLPGVIAGSVVGALAVVTLLGLLAFFLLRRRRRNRLSAGKSSPGTMYGAHEVHGTSSMHEVDATPAAGAAGYTYGGGQGKGWVSSDPKYQPVPPAELPVEERPAELATARTG